MVLGVCAVVVGCGGGESDSSQPSDEKAATVKALPRALLPTCRIAGFSKPNVKAVPAPGGQGRAWRLSYLAPPLVPTRRGQTTNVLIIERPPSVPPVGVKGGRSIDVAGRRVSLRSPSSRSNVYLAQWNTDRAHYLALANGRRDDVLKRFIACLP